MNSQKLLRLSLFVGLVFACSSSSQVKAQTATPTQSTEAQARQLVIEPQKALPAKAKRWALVVGVDRYVDPQISALRGAANDARTLADALIKYSGFPQDQVILLATDQPAERQP